MVAVAPETSRSRPGARRRRPPEERAEEILAVALDLFARRDFSRVTVRDIARACGINVALIYYYFGSKEELYRASIEHAVKRALGRYREARRHHDDPVDALNDWFDINLQLFAVLQRMAKVIIDYQFSNLAVPSIDRLIETLYRDELALLAENIAEGIRRGRFRPVDPDRLAEFVSTHLDGIFFAAMSRPDVDHAARMENFRATLWEHLDLHERRTRRAPRKR